MRRSLPFSLPLLLGNLACAGAPIAGGSSLPLPDAPPMPAPDTSGTVPVNGAELYFVVFNEGGPRPVMLLHGGWETPISGRPRSPGWRRRTR